MCLPVGDTLMSNSKLDRLAISGILKHVRRRFSCFASENKFLIQFIDKVVLTKEEDGGIN